MTRQYVSDLATTHLSTGGPDLATGALSLTVTSNSGFPTSGSFFTVEAPTGEHITVTTGIGTTTWGGLIRGENGTTAKIAPIVNGSILTEVFGARDASNFVQQGDARLTDQRVPTDHSVTAAKMNSGAATSGQIPVADGAGGVAYGALIVPVTTKTADYTATSSDWVIIVNAASKTITLPSAVAVAAGRQFVIKNGASGATTTVATAAGNIDGSATDTSMTAAYAVLRVVSDGANYFTI